MGCRSMCGPRFSPGRGFGQKSRRRSRDLAGTLPATTACARGVGRGNRRARSGPMPRQATFPAWPFLGPAASFAAGSSARRLVERNGARQRRAARPSAAPPRGRCSANSSKSASVSSLVYRHTTSKKTSKLCAHKRLPNRQCDKRQPQSNGSSQLKINHRSITEPKP